MENPQSKRTRILDGRTCLPLPRTGRESLCFPFSWLIIPLPLSLGRYSPDFPFLVLQLHPRGSLSSSLVFVSALLPQMEKEKTRVTIARLLKVFASGWFQCTCSPVCSHFCSSAALLIVPLTLLLFPGMTSSLISHPPRSDLTFSRPGSSFPLWTLFPCAHSVLCSAVVSCIQHCYRMVHLGYSSGSS